ncbi:hypothetical protein FJQ98_16495 [Lysinibacillus agricola]|uniref:Uncharacterized protein n=1 Tax=Lysinibacillus agricola TaxID=2590012 RepID=A0ABX7ALS4_9BACI|nr:MULTISPECIES: hypothetical protein [Lysinibacillus]KOS61471.1 hypothetical protein AN161_17930 [Lysinibacillus sp. FJAT-14222]QQP10845.1 hypothetical protein FJQ98_16495 [Lysinibacillus agricola]
MSKQPVPNYILKKALQLNELDAKQKKLISEIKNWMNLSGYSYDDIVNENGILMKLAIGEFENIDDIKQAFDNLNK